MEVAKRTVRQAVGDWGPPNMRTGSCVTSQEGSRRLLFGGHGVSGAVGVGAGFVNDAVGKGPSRNTEIRQVIDGGQMSNCTNGGGGAPPE